MIVLGLTGSIAMGKSEAARMLRRFGCPVFDSDKDVHRLMEKGGAAIPAIARLFPEAVHDGAIDRARLGDIVFNDKKALRALEGCLHPLVEKDQRAFLEKAYAGGATIAVLDIPLLFETGGEAKVDYVAVVSAPYEVQKQRVLSRPGMNEERFKAILTQQMDDAEKRRRADYVLDSGKGKRAMLRQIAAMLRDLSTKSGSVWPWG